jgi:membrane-bound serine protease (ClpP class)
MNRSSVLRYCIVFILSCVFTISSTAYAKEEAHLFSLKGHINGGDLEEVKEKLEELSEQKDATLVIEINSVSGELKTVLDMAKALYEYKALHSAKIIAYIDGDAIGPAAILPFVADEVHASIFVSWGDILASGDDGMPLNVLRSRIRSLINPTAPQRRTLEIFVEAMVDQELAVFEDSKGWHTTSVEEARGTIISPKGETLVVDQNQLMSQRIVKRPEQLERFRKKYSLQLEELEEVGEDEEIEVAAREALERIPSEVMAELKEYIKPKEDGENTIGHIYIDKSGIGQPTWMYVKSALDHYMKTKPLFIILELNTPGGEVFASQQISDALKEMDTNYGIPVVAYINNWAVSAGAMLTYSCRFVVITKDATLGAAEPVLPTQGGGIQTASEKINSALRTDFANRAEFYGRNGLIARAMVDKSMVVVMRHGKIIKLESNDEIRRVGHDPDEIITSEGKLLTLDAKSIMRYGVADIMVQPQSVEAITKVEQSRGKWPAAKSLLFSHDFFKAIPQAFISSYQMDWQLSFMVFLASPAIASLLFMGFLMGAYMELSSPGFGVPGIISAICIFFIILSSFSLQAVGWLEVIMIMVGLSLLAVELLVLPGFGVAGIAGIILCIAGLFTVMIPGIGSVDFDFTTDTFNAAGYYVIKRFAWLCSAFVFSIIGMIVMARYVTPRLYLLSKIVLLGEQNASEGFVAGALKEDMPDLGKKGVVASTLRPAGKILIEGEMFDAMSNGVFLEKGTKIIVVKVAGSKIIVEEQRDMENS